MTNAEQIRDMAARGMPRDVIAACVGCRPEYIRAVLSRQRHGGSTPGDVAHSKRQTAWRREYGDKGLARRAGRAAYQAARLTGATLKSADGAYTRAYLDAMRKTARAAFGAAPAQESAHV